MNYGVIAFNVIGIALIIVVVWWFFGGKIKPMMAKQNEPIKILVKDGIYQPALVQVPAHKEIVLHFVREDDSGCSKTLVFNQLELSFELPLNQLVRIVLPAQEKGEIDFTCQMGMYRGKIIILE